VLLALIVNVGGVAHASLLLLDVLFKIRFYRVLILTVSTLCTQFCKLLIKLTAIYLFIYLL